MTQTRRVDPHELCWLCSKPLLPGQATRRIFREGGFLVHARCYDEDGPIPGERETE